MADIEDRVVREGVGDGVVRDGVMRDGVIRVAAAVAAREPDALNAALDEAVAAELGEVVDEVLLQSILFVGYPAGLDALSAWRGRAAAPAPPPTAEDPALWVTRGARVCQAVYGEQYGPLRNSVRRLHPDVEEWVVSHGYGRVLGRAGLDLVTRELAIVAQLAVLGATRQLYSHARGALRVGASVADVERALEIADTWVPETARARVAQVWSEVCSRSTDDQERVS
jgi:4-carboxymuconolactone decarboxylase